MANVMFDNVGMEISLGVVHETEKLMANGHRLDKHSSGSCVEQSNFWSLMLCPHVKQCLFS